MAEMQEWKLSSLKDAGVVLIDCDHRTPPAAETGYPYIAIPQLKNGRIDLFGVRKISPTHFEEWTRKANPQHYDVILSRRCNPGETAHVPPNLKCALGQNLVLLRADGKKVLQQYLRWITQGPLWWEQISKFINVGAVFDSLRCADIPKFELPLPPISEQRAIAAVLEALDEKIELNQRMNNTLEGIAQALFKSWFVDFDPVKAKAEGREPEGMDDATAALFPSAFTESILGLIPEEWEASSIGVSFKLTMGQSPPGETYNERDEGVPFFQGRTDFGFRFPIERIYCTAPTRFAEQNDTLVSVRAPVGDVNIAWDRCCIGRGVAALRHNTGAISFTYYTAKQLQAQFKNFNSEGTVFGSINKTDFEKLPHIEPKKDIISLFETIVRAIDSKIRNNEEQIQALSKTRDQLLPRLITGKLRVGEISETVEAVAT